MVIFLHVPRTGGTTIVELLRTCLRPSICIDGTEDLRFLANLPEDKCRILRLAYGHMPYGLHRIIPMACRYVVFLRDPVDRVMSAYRYIQQTPEHPWFSKLRSGSTMEEFARYHENEQTRQLAVYDFAGAIREENRSWGITPYTSSILLDEAKGNLKKCNFIGLFEEFEKDVLRLFSFLDLSPPVTIPKLNRSEIGPSIFNLNARDMRTVRAYLRLDIEMYDYARSLRQESMELHPDRSYAGKIIDL